MIADGSGDVSASPRSPTMPVWAIVGPTASGKSAAGVELATDAFSLAATGGRDVEVVAVDAFTIYRGLDIASAKPAASDRALVPHHLIDVLDVSEEVSVAAFQSWAWAAIDDIHGRDRVPLLVGGSGLYFRAVVDELEFPPTDPTARAELTSRWADDPRGAHSALSRLDPEAAARIEPDNLRRSLRALEVMAVSGRAFSSFRTAWDDHSSRYNLAVDFLDPPTEVLRQRIRTRTQAMVAAGIVAEVATLAKAGMSTTARQGIGVAEALSVIDGRLAPGDLADAIARRTWTYARRQRAWFRRDPRCVAGRRESAAQLVAAHRGTNDTA